MANLLAMTGLLAACGSSDTDRLTTTTWYLVAGGEKNPSWQWTVPPDVQAQASSPGVALRRLITERLLPEAWHG